METGSVAGKLSLCDLKKVGRGAVYAAFGAALAYLLDYLGLTKDQNAAITTAVCSVLANLAHKWMSDTRPSVPTQA